MKTSQKKFLSLFCFLALVVPLEAWCFEELTDHDLTAVTAGSADTTMRSVEALTRIPFSYIGKHGDVSGEVFVLPMTDIHNQGTLQLMDNAQSNLRSLISVNAVNSPVQILLNLNININSTIGSINQLNHLLEKYR